MARTLLAVALLVLIGAGCASYMPTYATPAMHVGIETTENDFKVAATHLKGTAECTYLFGGIPMGDPQIVSKALGQIRDQAQMEGRPVALVNYTEDRTAWSVFFIKRDKVTITADLIEYTK
jgi:hypothetical protein